MIDVAVVGAGISGLAAAWQLHTRGRTVQVLESGQRPGGKIHSERHGPYLIECGPQGCAGSSESVWRLLEPAGLSDSVQVAAPASDHRFIYRDGRIHRLPRSPAAFFSTRLLSGRAKWRMLAEPFIRQAASRHETVDAFVRRRLGREAADYLAGPVVSGIYAGDAARLGVCDCFPALWELERTAGSLTRGAVARAFKRHEPAGPSRRRGLWSLTDGLSSLTVALARRLGQRLSLRSAVDSIRRADGVWRIAELRARAVIVSTPPTQAAAMLGGALGELLSGIRLAPLAVVHLGCQRTSGQGIPTGFGCLVPAHYGLHTLGWMFVSQLFPGRAPQTGSLVACYLGGTIRPATLDLDDDTLTAVALREFEQVMGASFEPDFTLVRRHRQGIPQPEVGHGDRIARIRRETSQYPGLFLAGNYLSGVSMSEAASSGFEAATQVEQYLDGSH